MGHDDKRNQDVENMKRKRRRWSIRRGEGQA
jgi:hypothetical protein